MFFANPVFEDDGLASTVELAKKISQHQPVLYINFPLTYTQVLKGEHTIRYKRAFGVNSRIYQPDLIEFPNLWVLEMPVMLPSNKIKNDWLYKKVLDRNNRRYRLHVLRAIQKLNWSSTIAVNALNPLYGKAFTLFSAIKHVYYCYDNIDAAFWLSNHGSELERELVSKCDEICVSSKGLQEKFERLKKPIFWIPNGMNPEHFTRRTEFPKGAFKGAYIGAMDNRLDYDLVGELLDKFPKFQLVLVGPIKCKAAEQLLEHSRVDYRGVVSTSEVSSLVEDCEIGLIPFESNDFTKYIYPLKINEYLHMGMAVLSTNFADLSPFKNHIHVVEAFEQAVNVLQNLSIDSGNHRKRIEFAKEQTWEARADKMREVLNG